MRIAADTNVFVRSAIGDDAPQMKVAQAALANADLVALSTHAMCEFAWVMRQGYKQTPARIAAGIRLLANGANVVTDRQAIGAGLAMLDAGGDFADGVIAHEGRALGADEFVSFDKKAVAILKKEGVRAKALG